MATNKGSLPNISAPWLPYHMATPGIGCPIAGSYRPLCCAPKPVPSAWCLAGSSQPHFKALASCAVLVASTAEQVTLASQRSPARHGPFLSHRGISCSLPRRLGGPFVQPAESNSHQLPSRRALLVNKYFSSLLRCVFGRQRMSLGL